MEEWQRLIVNMSGDRLSRLEKQIVSDIHKANQAIENGLATEEETSLLDDLYEILDFIRQPNKPPYTQASFFEELSTRESPELDGFLQSFSVGV